MALPSTPSLQTQGGVQVLNPIPLDPYEGPYASVAAANASVPSALRSISGTTGLLAGRSVVIDNGTIRQVYWWDGGIADVNLVLKSVSTPSNPTSIQYWKDANNVVWKVTIGTDGIFQSQSI